MILCHEDYSVAKLPFCRFFGMRIALSNHDGIKGSALWRDISDISSSSHGGKYLPFRELSNPLSHELQNPMKHRLILRALSVLILSFILGLGLKSLFRGSESQTARREVGAAKAVSPIRMASEPNAPGPVVTGAAPSEISSISNKFFATAESFWEQPILEEPFARFHDWAEQYLHAGNGNKSGLETEGLELVSARRQALAKLIKSNPERALELSVPARVRQALPDSVAGQLEERISGVGRLAVLGALAEPGKESQVVPTFRTASIGWHKLQA